MASRSILDEALLVGDDLGELVLVRHAQQGDNLLGDPARPRAGDVELSDLGRRQADAVGAHLRHERIDAVWSSDLIRAHHTAEAIASHHGLEVVVDPRLREIDAFASVPAGRTALDVLGEDGLAEMRRRFLAEQRWEAFPLSEPVDEFRRRIAEVFDAIVGRRAEHERVVVVSHTVVMNLFLARLLGLAGDVLVFPAHASISRLGRGDGRLALRTVNDTRHLDGMVTH